MMLKKAAKARNIKDPTIQFPMKKYPMTYPTETNISIINVNSPNVLAKYRILMNVVQVINKDYVTFYQKTFYP